MNCILVRSLTYIHRQRSVCDDSIARLLTHSSFSPFVLFVPLSLFVCYLEKQPYDQAQKYWLTHPEA